MSDNYIHLGDFEKFVRSKFKNIVEGEGLTIPRQIVGYTLDEIFSEDAVLTPAAPDSEEPATYCGGCGYTHREDEPCPTT